MSTESSSARSACRCCHAPFARSASRRPIARETTAGSASASPDAFARTPGSRYASGRHQYSAEDAVDHVARYGERDRRGGPDGRRDVVGRRPAAPRVLADLGQVLVEQPEVGVDFEVDGEDDPPRRHPAQLGQARRRVVPVVHGQDRQRDIGASRGQRQRRGPGAYRGTGTGGALRHHDGRRLHGDDRAVRRFVRARSGTDVDHEAARGGGQVLGDDGLPAGVGTAVGDVAPTDRVVGGGAHCRRSGPGVRPPTSPECGSRRRSPGR